MANRMSRNSNWRRRPGGDLHCLSVFSRFKFSVICKGKNKTEHQFTVAFCKLKMVCFLNLFLFNTDLFVVVTSVVY